MGQSKEQQKENFEKTSKKLPVGFCATPEDVSCKMSFSTGMPKTDDDADCGGIPVLRELPRELTVHNERNR